MLIRKKFPQIYEIEHPRAGVYWQVSARSKKWGINQRKTFPSKSLAEKYAEDLLEELYKNGRQTEFPKEKIVQAERYEGLTSKLANYGRTPEEAVEHYVRHLGDVATRQAKPFVRELLDQWEAFKQADQTVTPRYLYEIKRYCIYIKRKFGDLKPDEVKRNAIELWLKGLKVSNNTRKKYRRYISMFFKWVVDEGHITKNPASGIKFKSDDFNGGFFSAQKTKELLRHVVETNRDLVGYFAVLAFAGLRPTEGTRVQWEDFNTKTKQLYVRKGKTGARHMDLEPVALEWLEYHRKHSSKNAPFVRVTNLENRLKTIRSAVFNRGWIQDGLRHGFGTYYKALTNNIEKVADQMGNSVGIVKRHYARTIPSDECKEFWNLTPAVVVGGYSTK